MSSVSSNGSSVYGATAFDCNTAVLNPSISLTDPASNSSLGPIEGYDFASDSNNSSTPYQYTNGGGNVGKEHAPLPKPSYNNYRYSSFSGKHGSANGAASQSTNGSTFPEHPPQQQQPHGGRGSQSIASSHSNRTTPGTRPLTPSPMHPGIKASTNFYVPANTLVQVSCGENKWNYGYWRDNHRAITVLESSLKSGNTADLLFIRLADVALNDDQGHPMYLASNRHRPCYIALAPGTVIYYSVNEVNGAGGECVPQQTGTTKGSRRGGRGPQNQPQQPVHRAQYTDTFEPIELSALQAHLKTQTSPQEQGSNSPDQFEPQGTTQQAPNHLGVQGGQASYSIVPTYGQTQQF